MKINIYHGHTLPEAQGLCVVIDVLRAFTTAAFAFAQGAKEIILVASPQEAFMKFQRDPSLLLMGESEGTPIQGFHYSNSPSEIQNAPLSGRTLVQRTSSGTQGVVGCKHAPHILLASFVVAEATLKRIGALNPAHVSLIVTGRKNGDEDLALAEYLEHRLLNKPVDVEPALHRVRASLDFLHNSIRSLKLLFFAPLSPNFSAICLHMPLKFIDKFAKKYSIFSTQANYARSLLAAGRMKQGTVSYTDGNRDVELATAIDLFPFAMEVFKKEGDLVGRAV